MQKYIEDRKLVGLALFLMGMGWVALGLVLLFLHTDFPVATVTGLQCIALVLFSSGAATFVVHFKRTHLRESRNQTVIDRAADGIITTNEQGVIESLNAATERLCGYRASELVGHRITVLLSSAHPDAEEGDLWDFLRLNAIAASGVAHEVLGLHKNGIRFPMDLSISDAKLGNRSVFVAIVRDVSVRQKVQRALRAAHEELEAHVEERTADLKQTNAKLKEEIEERQRSEAEREKLLLELQRAMAEIKTLGGLIPICASCKKVRDDQGFWNQIEVYLREHSDAEFSHGICPECISEIYPEFEAPMKKQEEEDC